jgi:hypothetical protein
MSSNDAGNYDFYTAKYSGSSGELLWEKRYNGPANDFDEGRAVAVDSFDNVVVTGGSHNAGNYEDFYTAKYAAADGSLLWERRYNSPTNGYDVVTDMVVDSSDNVLVTGLCFFGSGFESYTAKYAAADGALVWEKRHRGPGNGGANAVAVASTGDVAIAGSFDNIARNTDFYTAKYAAADGSLLWEKYHNGPANNHDTAHAVAMDSLGNVLVTGSSKSDNHDQYTVKYASADGALVWDKRYNGTGNSNDVGRAVAIDGNGDVIVTGQSFGSGSDNDFYTAKYAAADGGLLWEKRYNGPANRSDTMTSGLRNLALGPNGMVAILGSSPDSANRSDYATVVYWETLPAISVLIAVSGVRLQFTGVPLTTYRIERAPAVSGPWEVIANPVASATGFVEFIDTERPPETAFYRTRSP